MLEHWSICAVGSLDELAGSLRSRSGRPDRPASSAAAPAPRSAPAARLDQRDRGQVAGRCGRWRSASRAGSRRPRWLARRCRPTVQRLAVPSGNCDRDRVADRPALVRRPRSSDTATASAPSVAVEPGDRVAAPTVRPIGVGGRRWPPGAVAVDTTPCRSCSRSTSADARAAARTASATAGRSDCPTAAWSRGRSPRRSASVDRARRRCPCSDAPRTADRADQRQPDHQRRRGGRGAPRVAQRVLARPSRPDSRR